MLLQQPNLVRIYGASKIYLNPHSGFGFVCGFFVFGPCFVMQYSYTVLSSFAIISLRNRELIGLH